MEKASIPCRILQEEAPEYTLQTIGIPAGCKEYIDGGLNLPSNPSLHYNQTIPLRNPSGSQYVFEGWYADSAYRNRITQITAGSTQNYVLYAKWKKNLLRPRMRMQSLVDRPLKFC